MSGDVEVEVPARRGYTVVPNDLLQPGMSARTYGVLVYLLGRPPGWKAYATHLAGVFAEGRDAIANSLSELIDAGLLTRERFRDDKGMPRTRVVLNVARVDGVSEGQPPIPESQDPENADPRSTALVITDGTTTEETQKDLGAVQPSLIPDPTPARSGRPSRRRPEVELPDTWQPLPRHADYAREHRLDLDLERDRFKAHAREHQRRARVWDAAFDRWLINARTYSRSGGGGGGALESPPDDGRSVFDRMHGGGDNPWN